jgi:hypothetical protein
MALSELAGTAVDETTLVPDATVQLRWQDPAVFVVPEV